jgi:tetratricopeptide (TPR) repeat protein
MDAKDLAVFQAALQLKGGVVGIVHFSNGPKGSAFVLNSQQRLLATAAHVADAVRETEKVKLTFEGGAEVECRIAHIWYHPACQRTLDDHLQARSDKPSDGRLTWDAADVAVIQLSPEELNLPSECKLADDDEFPNLEGQPAGLLGYHDGALALAIGAITRVYKYGHDGSTALDERQTVGHTAKLGPGSSGGPVFLANSHVVAVGCFGNKDEEGSYRVDCLRELLAYHGLSKAVAGGASAPSYRSEWGPDPRLPVLRRAVRLVGEADELRRKGEYKAAGQKLNEAIVLVPDYAKAYLLRGKVYLYYCGHNWTGLSTEQRVRYSEWAYDDAIRCREFFSDWAEPYTIIAEAVVYRNYAIPRQADTTGEIRAIDELLAKGPFNAHQRAFLINCRAQTYQLLGNLEFARDDYDASMRLDPEEPRWPLNSAQFWDSRKRPGLAVRDRRAAEKLRQHRRSAEKRDLAD